MRQHGPLSDASIAYENQLEFRRETRNVLRTNGELTTISKADDINTNIGTCTLVIDKKFDGPQVCSFTRKPDFLPETVFLVWPHWSLFIFIDSFKRREQDLPY